MSPGPTSSDPCVWPGGPRESMVSLISPALSDFPPLLSTSRGLSTQKAAFCTTRGCPPALRSDQPGGHISQGEGYQPGLLPAQEPDTECPVSTADRWGPLPLTATQ